MCFSDVCSLKDEDSFQFPVVGLSESEEEEVHAVKQSQGVWTETHNNVSVKTRD